MNQLVKVAIVGNVDDGKSTFVGKLLHQTNSLYDDQIKKLQEISTDEFIDFSLITDGLKNERARKVTIDIAYRYFSSQNKRIVLIDCPGHHEYLKNMISGVSQADLALVMVDITKGIQELTKIHLKMASKLGPKKLIIAVNKMDQVEYKQESFNKIKNEILSLCDADVIPISALSGENINSKSFKMPWADKNVLSTIDEYEEIEQSNSVRALIYPSSGDAFYTQVINGYIEAGKQYQLLPANETVTINKVSSYDEPDMVRLSREEAGVITLDEENNISTKSLLIKNSEIKSRYQFKFWGVWVSTHKFEEHKQYNIKTVFEESICKILIGRDEVSCYDDFIGEVISSKSLNIENFVDSQKLGSFLITDGSQIVCVGLVEGLL